LITCCFASLCEILTLQNVKVNISCQNSDTVQFDNSDIVTDKSL
jgi:hypothetical protein